VLAALAPLASVLALSATGSDVVYATSAPAPVCPQIVLWRTKAHRTTRFPRSLTACESTSTGTGIAGVATAGGRALWLYYAGGNFRDWLLYTATATRPTPKRIRFVERAVEKPAPIVLGRPDEGNLPYALDNIVIDLRPNGSRRWTWKAPGPVAQLAAGNDRVAVQLRDGSTYVMSRTGTPGPVRNLQPGTIRYAAIGLASQQGTSIQLGARSFPIGKGATFVDLMRNSLVYQRGSKVRGIRISDGKDVLLARGTLASFARGGLAYTSGRVVLWAPWASVQRRFGD